MNRAVTGHYQPGARENVAYLTHTERRSFEPPPVAPPPPPPPQMEPINMEVIISLLVASRYLFLNSASICTTMVIVTDIILK